MHKKCLFCEKEFRTIPSKELRSKFCCRICKTNHFKGKHISPSSEFKKGQKPWNTGKKGMYSDKQIEHLRELNRQGIIGMKGKKLTLAQRIRHSMGTLKGKDCHFWRGGVSKPNELLRKSLQYKLWRADVFERDNYTCVACGEKGGRINADHIQSYALFPLLRFNILNGQTLCVSCHDIKTKEDMKFITKGVRKRA